MPLNTLALALSCLLSVAVASIATAPATHAASVAILEDLGTPIGWNSNAVAVNDTEMIAGYSTPDTGTLGGPGTSAWVWTSAIGMTDIGNLGGDRIRPAAINAAGTVVGTATIAGGATHGFIWSTGAGIADLGTLGTGNTTLPVAINDAGTVIGSANIDATHTHGFVWSSGTGITDIGTLGGTRSSAAALNESDVVVGSSYISGDANEHAFRWTALGGMTDLGTLSGGNSEAQAINDSGQISGISNGAAFRVDPMGIMTDIGRPSSFVSEVVGIDATGNVVGWGFASFETAVSFRISPVSGYEELEPGVRPNVIRGVSANGWFTGVGVFSANAFVGDGATGIQELAGPAYPGGSTPNAVNNRGTVIGNRAIGSQILATRWTATSLPTISLGNSSIVEADTSGTRTIKIPVTLSQPSTTLVEVPYSVYAASGSNAASPGTDFALKVGKVKFNPSLSTGLTTTTKQISVVINDDTMTEVTESLVVRIGAPTAGPYSVAVGVQAVHIIDNDPSGATPTFSVGGGSIWEGDSGTKNTMNISISKSIASLTATSVRVTVTGGTATASSDFTSFSKVAKFPAGSTKATVVVSVKPDADAEANETILLTLSAPSAGITLQHATGTVTILNDDH